MTNLVRELSGQPEKINKFGYGFLLEHMGTLTTLQSAFIFFTSIHLEHICPAHMWLGTCSKDPSHFSRSSVHSVPKKKYINLSDSLLGFSEAT
jgi:hypothetical protein